MACHSSTLAQFEGTVRMLLLKRIKAMFMCVANVTYGELDFDHRTGTRNLPPTSSSRCRSSRSSIRKCKPCPAVNCNGSPSSSVLVLVRCPLTVVYHEHDESTAADIYLIDEPSAYLDSEQRIIAARVMKRCGAVASVGVSLGLIRAQLHPSREEDGFRNRARLDHGAFIGLL